MLGGSNFDLEPVTLEGPGAYLCNYIVRDRAAWEVSVKVTAALFQFCFDDADSTGFVTD